MRPVIPLMTLILLSIVAHSFALEYPFTSVDIYSEDPTEGTTLYNSSSDTYTVTADGHDIWDAEDDFRFLYVEMNGDFSVSVRVDDPEGSWPHSWAKAGIMVRQDLSPGSKDVYYVATRDNGAAFQWRDSPRSLASWTGTSSPPPSLSYPIWLRITRQANVFTGSYSWDGQSWIAAPANTHVLSMSDPVLVGICLTSHVSGVLTTATFGDFHIPKLEASTLAIVPPDQVVYEGDTVVLNGASSWNATGFRWEQIVLAEEPHVDIENPGQAVATFKAPQLDVAAVLSFQLTAFGSSANDSAITRVTVKANNAPAIPPPDLRGRVGNLSSFLEWQLLLDADCYVVKRAEQLPDGGKSPFQTVRPCVRDTAAVDQFLQEGTTYYYIVTAKNAFPPYEGPPSSEIVMIAMSNLAFRPDATPIALVSSPSGGGLKNLNAIMNGITQESFDTFDDYATLDEDWFGYSWPQPLFFDHITYYEGQHFQDGGWWTSLTVQFSDDGRVWNEAPNVRITPAYDFSDSLVGRTPFSRFDLSFETVRARYIRIYGTPGGVAGFTSIAELEVYGHQGRGDLVVYGIDQTVNEWETVFLDASHSFSTRGPITHYSWQQIGSSPAVALQNSDQPIADFEAPGVDQDTLLTFAVTAGDGTEERTDEVYVLVRNLVTRADAGPDITALEGTLVQLDGSASATTSGELSFAWTQRSGPSVVLSEVDSARPLFTAPSIWRYSENLVFELQVDDGLGRPDSVSSDTVTVLVRNTLNNMPHIEKAGLIVIEAENYSFIDRHRDDRGTWNVFAGSPAYVAVPGIPGGGGTRSWEDAAEIGYDLSITRPGAYFVKLRRFVPHGSGYDGNSSNSCHVGLDGNPINSEFDNQTDFNRWVWVSDDVSLPLSFPTPGDYSLSIRCREAGYRIDRIVVYQQGALPVPDDGSSEIGPLESMPARRIVCSRQFGDHYTPGTVHSVSLHIDVNLFSPHEALALVEFFPQDFALIDPAGADTSVSGRLSWVFSAEEIADRTITYKLAIPQGTSGVADFSGHLFYGDVADQHISGQTLLYPSPVPPPSVSVEMLVSSVLSWSTPPGDDVIAYHVYRSSDGSNWIEISGPRLQNSYVDTTIQPGFSYIYKVASENPAGYQTPLELCQPTSPLSAPSMEIREVEDYNHSGGRFPGGPEAPAAISASDEYNLDPSVDYFYQDKSRTNLYRPRDPTDIRPGEAASGWFMGYSTPGDWWRYCFDVPVPGYVKLAYRGSTGGSSPATIEFFWDEKFVGEITYNTPGGWRDWTYYSLAPFYSGIGGHTLRMHLASGNADYDLIALGYDWSLGNRKVIFGEDFNNYSETSQVESPGGWTILSGSSSAAAWQLWNTQGDLLTTWPGQPGPDLPGMADNYMVSNGDFAPDVSLDEQLLSPEIDCTNFQDVTLQFSTHININEEDSQNDLQTTDLDISIYNPGSQSWSDWTTIFTQDSSAGDYSSSSPLSFDLSSLADGKKIRLRWRFYNSFFDFWWAIDDVILAGSPVATPGILSVGFVDQHTLSLSWESFGTGFYTVQYKNDLSETVWINGEGISWPIIGNTWTDSLPPAQAKRFYRVLSK